jgi:hypothetical protein
MKYSLYQSLVLLSLVVIVLTITVLIFENVDWKEHNYYNERVSYVESSEEVIENGIHLATGLIADDGWQLVRKNCLACHSSKLVIQNRATKEGWEYMIDWMQRTQGLWSLGEDHNQVIEYLSKNYAPTQSGRRVSLNNIEWYNLED